MIILFIESCCGIDNIIKIIKITAQQNMIKETKH